MECKNFRYAFSQIGSLDYNNVSPDFHSAHCMPNERGAVAPIDFALVLVSTGISSREREATRILTVALVSTVFTPDTSYRARHVLYESDRTRLPFLTNLATRSVPTARTYLTPTFVS